MTKHADDPSENIEVIPAAREQESVLGNLIELYIHDFSELRDVDLGPDGRFGYRLLPLYWNDPDRHAFLIRIAGKLAGFALVKKGSEVSGNKAVWDMAEFFVIRGQRRRGFGTQVMHELRKRLPGPWEIRVMQSNVPAQHFWARAVSMFTGKPAHPVPFQKAGENWKLFSFESRSVS
jgi:predicted acetyltransferase